VNALTQRALHSYGLAKPCDKSWTCEKNGMTPTVKFERNAARKMCHEQGCLDGITTAMYGTWHTWRSADKLASVCKTGRPDFDYAPDVAAAVTMYALRANHIMNGTMNTTSTMNTTRTTHKKSNKTSEDSMDTPSWTSWFLSKVKGEKTNPEVKKGDDQWTLEKCQKAHCDPQVTKKGQSERGIFCQHASSDEDVISRAIPNPCFKHCCDTSNSFWPSMKNIAPLLR